MFDSLVNKPIEYGTYNSNLQFSHGLLRGFSTNLIMFDEYGSDGNFDRTTIADIESVQYLARDTQYLARILYEPVKPLEVDLGSWKAMFESQDIAQTTARLVGEGTEFGRKFTVQGNWLEFEVVRPGGISDGFLIWRLEDLKIVEVRTRTTTTVYGSA